MDGGSTEMMIVMQEGSTPEEVERILERLESAGASGHVSTSDVVTVIAVMGERDVIAGLPLEAYPGVDKVLPILRPYKLVSREFRRSDTVITVGGTSLGGGHVALIAGPCSVETREQLLGGRPRRQGRGRDHAPRRAPTSRALRRTRFRDWASRGWRSLPKPGEATGLPVVTELMDPRHLEDVVTYSDVIQIGARNMQNFQLLSAVGRGRPAGAAQARAGGHHR